MGKDIKNCWEFMKCPNEKRDNCLAFKWNYGDKCWILINKFTKGCHKDNKGCINCPWFKMNYKL